MHLSSYTEEALARPPLCDFFFLLSNDFLLSISHLHESSFFNISSSSKKESFPLLKAIDVNKSDFNLLHFFDA